MKKVLTEGEYEKVIYLLHSEKNYSGVVWEWFVCRRRNAEKLELHKIITTKSEYKEFIYPFIDLMYRERIAASSDQFYDAGSQRTYALLISFMNIYCAELIKKHGNFVQKIMLKKYSNLI